MKQRYGASPELTASGMQQAQQMFKITSCSASCFPEKCRYCQLFHKTNKPVNERSHPPSSQWKHSRTELLPSFLLLLTGTTFVAPRGVKIRNIQGLQRLLFPLEPFPSYHFQGLPNRRSPVFSEESFLMYKLQDVAGQARWQGQRLQGPLPLQALTPHTALHKNMWGKILESFSLSETHTDSK